MKLSPPKILINTCFFVLRDLIGWLEFTLILRMKLSPAFWQQNPLNCLTNCTYNGRTVYLWFKLREQKIYGLGLKIWVDVFQKSACFLNLVCGFQIFIPTCAIFFSNVSINFST